MTERGTETVVDLHDIPGTSVYEIHAAGGLCPSCSAQWAAEDQQAAWEALSDAERIARRWASARRAFLDRIAAAHPENNPPF